MGGDGGELCAVVGGHPAVGVGDDEGGMGASERVEGVGEGEEGGSGREEKRS